MAASAAGAAAAARGRAAAPRSTRTPARRERKVPARERPRGAAAVCAAVDTSHENRGKSPPPPPSTSERPGSRRVPAGPSLRSRGAGDAHRRGGRSDRQRPASVAARRHSGAPLAPVWPLREPSRARGARSNHAQKSAARVTKIGDEVLLVTKFHFSLHTTTVSQSITPVLARTIGPHTHAPCKILRTI